MLKKIIIALFALVALVLVAAVAIPYFYKDEIVAEVKKAANEQLNATLEFSDVDISLFRQFPKLSVGLQGLVITGQGDFKGVELINTERLDVGVDLMRALKNDIIIRNLHLEKPVLHVYVLKDGRANYDIAKETGETTEETEASPIQLEQYSIADGHLIYEDLGLDMKADIQGITHNGNGNLGATIYDLNMQTEVQSLTVDYGGVRYLSKAHADWDAVLNMDMINSKYTFKENDIVLNNLKVLLDGWVQMPNETDILMDLKFGSPANDFKSLLSIIPGAYTKDFEGVKADGSLAFGGFAKGTYNEHSMPNFKLDFNIGNGSFQYPDLPLGVSNIQVDAKINSPSSNFDKVTVDIPAFAMKVGNNPLEGYFKLRTPMSDPNVDAKMKGKLIFAELAKAFPIEGLKELTGILDADLAVKAAMSQIDKGLYDQVDMRGFFNLSDMVYRAEGTPDTRISAMQMNFSPQNVTMPKFEAKVGKSDFSANATIDNVLAYFSTDKTMKGNMTLRSNFIDANELMGEETAEAEVVKTPEENSAETFDRWDFTVDGKINKLQYEDYTLTDMAMDGHFTPNEMKIGNFGMKIGNSDLSGNGTILGAMDYLFENKTLRGDVNLKSNYFDLNQFMTDEETAAAEDVPAEVILVPENVDMNINADINKVIYTNYTLSDLTGEIKVEDSQAELKNCTASTLGGMVGLTGKYNTADAANPLFNMDMAIQSMSFQEAWKNAVTIKQLAPIAQFLNGNFNTTLSLSGALGKDMMPDLNTLSAAGLLETFNATLNNFKPLNEIGNKLNVSQLRSMNLENMKTWFEIKDGKVLVNPFNIKAGDVAMTIQGGHGITTEMDYQILTKTPRSAMEKNPVGAAASGGLKWLSGEASKYGVSLNQGDFINVRFDLTGTMLNPKIKVKVLGSDGEATMQDQAKATLEAAAQKAKDSLRNVANAKLDEAKGQANAAIDKAKDSLKNVATQKADELKDKATQTVKDEVGKVLDKEVGDKLGDKVGDKIDDKAKEVLGGQGDKKVDEVKDKLKDWNPFGGKKKKDGGK